MSVVALLVWWLIAADTSAAAPGQEEVIERLIREGRLNAKGQDVSAPVVEGEALEQRVDSWLKAFCHAYRRTWNPLVQECVGSYR